MRELSAGANVGNYRIEGVVGRGGMGIVYRAAQRRPERTVALKVIAPDLADDDQFRGRFERESNMAAQIEHPNVIPVYEVGEDAGLLYIVMRYVEGTDLAGLVRREGQLAPSRAARIVAQVGSALDAAHRRGLVHRDVKPGNVLIADPGADEHAYLTDFGLVKLIDSDTSGMTATGAFVGTLDYLAPEQAEGHADARADIYALGGVLYNALTGSAPFPQPTPAAKLWAMMNTPPPSVAATVPGVPGDFDRVVTRAMAKAPDDRYQTAGELGRAAVAAAEAPSTAAAPAREEPATVASPETKVPSTVASATREEPSNAASAPRRASLPRWPFLAVGIALVAVVVVLALALGGGDDTEAPQTTASTPASEPTTTDSGASGNFEELGTVQLEPVAGGADGEASGTATIGMQRERHMIYLFTELPKVDKDQEYGVWLWNSNADALLLSQDRPDSQGEYSGFIGIPADWQNYKYVDISLEPAGSDDGHSGRSVLRGATADLQSP